MKGLNVLSLFDGMSCMQIALRELNIPVASYFASEVDKHAIAQTQLNFPNTVQLGDVRSVDVSKLPYIHILAGGSPCQSFSFAGKRNGMTTKENVEIYTLDHYLKLKNDGFEFEGQSYLFWEYMRILKDIKAYNPDILFLLENVEMGAKWERVLSEAIGIYGVLINSALVSAQNRKRIYWTNFRTKRVGLFGELHSDIPQPHDRGILLKDILEDDVDEKYYLTDNAIARLSNNDGDGFRSIKNDGDKSSTILATQHKLPRGIDLICVAMRGREVTCLTPKRTEYGKKIRKDYERGLIKEQHKYIQQLEPRHDGKTNCLTSVQKDNLVMQISPALCANKADLIVRLNDRQQKNFVAHDEKTNSLLATSYKGSQANGMSITNTGYRIRRLTPTECARLQTIPAWYRWACSDTQAYRMLGNGWTVEVIKHILRFADFNNITQCE